MPANSEVSSGGTAGRRSVWPLVSLAWLAPALLAAFRAWAQWREPDGSVQWRVVAWEGGDWLLYGLVTPLVFVLARRFRLEKGRLARSLAVHVPASLAALFVWCAAGYVLHDALIGGGPYGQGLLAWFMNSLPFGIAVYFAVVGVEHAAHYFVEARERETQAARLAAQLAEARMKALRMQLHPHFLLNSLNAIAVIVRDRDSETAVRVVELLGDMLRRVIRSGGRAEVPLREELAFVRQYLEVEQVRFSDRLRPEFDVDDALLDAAVPELLLQPLVENALRHGLARRPGATLLRVSARREGGDLVLEVIDDGAGPPARLGEVVGGGEGPGGEGEGVGLRNVRERLATMYGARASFELAATAGGGARATVRLPYRPMGDESV